jgi:hypothetical protein
MDLVRAMQVHDPASGGTVTVQLDTQQRHVDTSSPQLNAVKLTYQR